MGFSPAANGVRVKRMECALQPQSCTKQEGITRATQSQSQRSDWNERNMKHSVGASGHSQINEKNLKSRSGGVYSNSTKRFLNEVLIYALQATDNWKNIVCPGARSYWVDHERCAAIFIGDFMFLSAHVPHENDRRY